MSLKYLISKELIPNDGSISIIEEFEKNTNADILVFPDVHFKRGAMIANGMLISSQYNIYLSCLGVENCGFTFGKILNNKDERTLISSFENYSKLLRDRVNIPKYSVLEIKMLFEQYLKKEYQKKKFLYNYLGFRSEKELLVAADTILDSTILKLAAESLCTLGGGNHFFEIHKIVDTFDDDMFKKGEYVFMLHSDSIAVGDKIYELYSDLHEMKRTGSLKERLRVAKFKFYQSSYFNRLCKIYPEIKEDLNKIFQPSDDYQFVDIRTPLGKVLMLAHNLSSIFGEMNRDEIINMWGKSQEIQTQKISSHSHDNVTAEMHYGKIRIVHRNGVQNIGDDKYCILPSAMGDFSFVMKNTFNEDAYFSTNHGTGRMQDKHIAKEQYTEKETTKEMGERKVSLFRVGNGSLAEQNMHAFKDPESIISEIEKYKLAYKAAKTYPVAVIKG